MRRTRLWRFTACLLACAVLVGVLPLGAVPGGRTGLAAPGAWVLAQESTSMHLPLVGRNHSDPTRRFSRFGVGVVSSATASVPISWLNSLGAGWYLDWSVKQNPPRPGGVSFAQLVDLNSDGSSVPSGATLDAAVRANRGALWLIGNEPDSPYKNNTTPAVYARAYHDLYYQIKAADPTALVSAGGIVQPTPLRLKYLDCILAEYRTLYPTEHGMPVDVWNIHVHILREVREGRPDSWGAYIPPGLPDDEGELYEIRDHYNIEVFKQMVVRFREWMAINGYRDCPLIITEFGILMPWDYLDQDRQRADAITLTYMGASVEFLLTEADSVIGCPYDGNRLVQRWAWYCYSYLGPDSYNGNLFDSVTKQRTVFGERYAALVAAQPATVNLYAWKGWTVPASAAIQLSQLKDPVRLYATVVNNGNVSTRNAIAVRFYEGNPDGGGHQIGETQYIAPLDGGAGLATVSVAWTPSSVGHYDLYVRVDPPNNVAETDEGDNQLQIASVDVS